MSSKNVINKVIKENYKLNEKDNIGNEIKNENNDNIKENSFNQLLNLQLLIKKHSGLKELCKYLNNFYFK